jgi:phosphotriesterase-related protein
MPVITTNGQIEKEKLGITLPHEHLFIDLSFTYKTPENAEEKKYATEKISLNNLHLLKSNAGFIRDNLYLNDANMAAEELLQFKLAGGSTIVEQSTIGAGRNIKAIHNIAKKLGINIIVSTGYYVSGSLPKEIVNLSQEELASNMVKEARDGIENTGIKPGVIGELGLGPKIQDWENKVLAAAAVAQKETGLAIFVHIQAVPTIPGFSGELNGLEALKILGKQGADLEKVVICHTDAKINLKYIKKIIENGAYAEFDHIGKEFYYLETDFLMDRDIDRVMALKELIDDGCKKKILISQDACLKTDLINYGGTGYAHILNDICPIMLKKCISQQDINNIIIDNPAELLNVDSKYF